MRILHARNSDGLLLLQNEWPFELELLTRSRFRASMHSFVITLVLLSTMSKKRLMATYVDVQATGRY